MTEDDDGDIETDDVYDPGEAAVDPAVPTRSAGGRGVASSEPPQMPTVGRWFENLPVVFERALGPVGWAWLVLQFGVVAAVVGIALLVVVAAPDSVWQPEGLAESLGVWGLAVLPVSLGIYTAFGVAWLGPIRPLRRAAFEGPDAVSSVGDALGQSLERGWAIALTVTVAILTIGCLHGCLLYSFGGPVAGQSGAMTVVVDAVVTAGVGFVVWPVLYLVSATDVPALEVPSTAVEYLRRDFGYLVGGYIIIGAGTVGLTVGASILTSGLVVWTGLNPAGIGSFGVAAVPLYLIGWLGWVAYTALFVTIEEAPGRERSAASSSR